MQIHHGITRFLLALITALVLTGAGRMFMAGADIREFNLERPADVPDFHVVLGAMEAAPKPIVAAINGVALGGGLELAMGCHYRLIAPGAQVGQPEIKLGFIPGAGGTQRLARLIGPEKALGIVLTGDPVGAEDARAMGIVDEVAGGDVLGARCELAAASGCEGIVCAAPDLAATDPWSGRLVRVVPGIRMPGEATHDQARVASPRDALAAGADLLVVGRAVTAADDPAAAASAIVDNLMA